MSPSWEPSVRNTMLVVVMVVATCAALVRTRDLEEAETFAVEGPRHRTRQEWAETAALNCQLEMRTPCSRPGQISDVTSGSPPSPLMRLAPLLSHLPGYESRSCIRHWRKGRLLRAMWLSCRSRSHMGKESRSGCRAASGLPPSLRAWRTTFARCGTVPSSIVNACYSRCGRTPSAARLGRHSVHVPRAGHQLCPMRRGCTQSGCPVSMRRLLRLRR